VAREFNVLALLKGKQRYLYVYDDASLPVLLEAFREQAGDASMNFTWFDAAVLGEKARQQAERHAPAGSSRPARLGFELPTPPPPQEGRAHLDGD
jgi:hypothetical protein